MKHMFLDFLYAKIIWRIVCMPFNLHPLRNIKIWGGGGWLNGVEKKDKGPIWIAAAACLTNILVIDCYHMPCLDQR
jgi:hypothetical protein